MKTRLIAFVLLGCTHCVYSQQYPEPEFANEIYLIRKSEPGALVRLEKDYSALETKVKVGGIGGAEHGYEIDGEASNVRIGAGTGLSFVYSTGASAGESSPERDSVMRAHGMDPSMSSGGFSRFDPSSMITLYKSDISKGKRKVYLQKAGGYFAGKLKSSQKYTFSVKVIREGYWELVIDKPLPKGEYVFTMMTGGLGSADGSMALYAFGVDE